MNAIILFDGECNLCHSSVQFIIKRDKKKYFQFASLQGDIGSKLLTQCNKSDSDSIVLIKDSKCYTRSGAALRISRHLEGPWKLFYVFLLVPSPIRDYIYSVVAKNRYKWFGKKTSCLLPTSESRKRFLD